MKLFSNIQSRSRRTNISAFTLVEMMISVWIYLVIFIGVMVAIQVFALRIYTLAATKLTATEDGRKALDQIRDDIRQAKTLQVGNFDEDGCGNPLTSRPITGTNSSAGRGAADFFHHEPRRSLYDLLSGHYKHADQFDGICGDST